MSSSLPPAERWSRQIQDALADSAKVREGLRDEEALPFIDWGVAMAEYLGRRLVAPGAPEPTEEQVGNVAYALTRLMTRMNWLVTYRDKKDSAWLTKTFQMVNMLSQELHGDDAPTFTDEEIAAWIADHPNHTNGELLRGLVARLTPSALGAAPEPSEAPPVPPAPLSDSVFGPATHETDMPSQAGDTND
jgi:hypothetical protein